MELAFTDREGIMGLMEGLIATTFREVLGVEVRRDGGAHVERHGRRGKGREGRRGKSSNVRCWWRQ